LPRFGAVFAGCAGNTAVLQHNGDRRYDGARRDNTDEKEIHHSRIFTRDSPTTVFRHDLVSIIFLLAISSATTSVGSWVRIWN
jgi:hypothetical protein